MASDAERETAPGFYADLWPAAVLARLRALPPGAPALVEEIDALRALLRAVAEDGDLDAAKRLAAFCRGVDSLGRLYRLRQVLEQADPAAGLADLDRALADLGLGAETAAEEGG